MINQYLGQVPRVEKSEPTQCAEKIIGCWSNLDTLTQSILPSESNHVLSFALKPWEKFKMDTMISHSEWQSEQVRVKATILKLI